jgi:DNA-binding transcriptional ArsR family regulator
MSNRSRRNMRDEAASREAGASDLDTEILRMTSIGGGESRSAQYTGTKALMLAILEDGIRSYLSPVGRIRSEAEYWVMAGRQRSPFSFTVVCETLGLEPDAVRAALRRLREKNVSPRRVLGRSRPNVRRTGRLTTRKLG